MSGDTMADKERLEEEFLAFLRESHFPDDSIYRGPCFGYLEARRWRRDLSARLNRLLGQPSGDETFPYYADLALLDLESREYIALVQFRLEFTEEVEAEVIAFFEPILSSLQTQPPVFLVVPQLNVGFRVYQLGENRQWKDVPRRNFPRYSTLAAGHAAAKTLAAEARSEAVLDRFSVTCYSLAGALGLLTVGGIVGVTSLNDRQLVLLLAAALLALAPHSLGLHQVRLQPAPRPRPARAR